MGNMELCVKFLNGNEYLEPPYTNIHMSVQPCTFARITAKILNLAEKKSRAAAAAAGKKKLRQEVTKT